MTGTGPLEAPEARGLRPYKMQVGPGAFGAANARPITVYRQC
jgi:hypothetical protein